MAILCGHDDGISQYTSTVKPIVLSVTITFTGQTSKLFGKCNCYWSKWVAVKHTDGFLSSCSHSYWCNVKWSVLSHPATLLRSQCTIIARLAAPDERTILCCSVATHSTLYTAQPGKERHHFKYFSTQHCITSHVWNNIWKYSHNIAAVCTDEVLKKGKEHENVNSRDGSGQPIVIYRSISIPGSRFPSGFCIGLKIKRSGVRSLLLVMCNFSFHTVPVYPTVMGTGWTWIVSKWLRLPAYLYDVCAVFSQGRWACSNVVCATPGRLMVGWIW